MLLTVFFISVLSITRSCRTFAFLISSIARGMAVPDTAEYAERRIAGTRVLVAEDVEINADILMDLLEMEGVESVTLMLPKATLPLSLDVNIHLM